MGRMMPEKRVLDFCKAVDLAKTYTSNEFRVVIVGNGYHLAEVREWADDKPYVQVTGSVANEAVTSLIDSASALVMTSHGFDNQPMVIAESIIAGRGVVSVDPDLLLDIDPDAGVYPADASPEGLAQQLAELIDHPEILQSTSDAASISAPVFSAAAGLKRLESAYATALQHNQ